ncbi:carbohydrate ABC transporter permease [Alteribacter keqinensis]|uniref:Sugar ABC transporter permease n=1 Tax=Alteribacter keqinensis TaxID=2483800 RepID=A0A3M7TPV9_9BACI|nr:sugar ABC transporter permease [Alteribacter keqinensis]RNA67676.1 sugar ABC transporter permease [Alteribacter keqinensis]
METVTSQRQEKSSKRHGGLRKLFSLEKSPLLYLLPMILFMLIMIGYPISRVIYLSFTQNILTRPDLGVEFIGLSNYWTLMTSAEFWNTVARTVGWTSLSVGGKVLIGFGIALLLSKPIGFKKVYMFLLMVPWVTPMVVAAVSFRWMFDGQFGTVNYLLLTVGIIQENIIWLGQAATAFIATAIADMWLGLPFMILVFMAGLQAIPEEVKEAARMDGANGMQLLGKVILPMMKPVVLVAVTLSTIWTFNSFGVIWPMTRGGPLESTRTLVVDAYVRSFGAFDLGMGGAVAVVIFIFLMIFTYMYKRLLMKQGEM